MHEVHNIGDPEHIVFHCDQYRVWLIMTVVGYSTLYAYSEMIARAQTYRIITDAFL